MYKQRRGREGDWFSDRLDPSFGLGLQETLYLKEISVYGFRVFRIYEPEPQRWISESDKRTIPGRTDRCGAIVLTRYMYLLFGDTFSNKKFPWGSKFN